MATVGGDPLSRWSGPVQLTDPQLNDLAKGIVQRMPEYVDPADAPETALASLDPGGVNATFGRRFIIKSFRWLNSSEL